VWTYIFTPGKPEPIQEVEFGDKLVEGFKENEVDL